MTELREKLRPLSREWFKNLFEMVEGEGRGIPGFTAKQAMAELEPHLALFAGGSGEVSDLADAARFARTVLANMKAFRDEGDLQAMGDAIKRIDAALAIDRPAPVVDREAVLETIANTVNAFRRSDAFVSRHHEKIEAAADSVISAVNAVSEAQVRADERERLAKLAESERDELAEDAGANDQEGGSPSRSKAMVARSISLNRVAEWLRAQEGGK